VSWVASALKKPRHWADPDLAHERALFERGAELLNQAGLSVAPYADPSLPNLRSRKDPSLTLLAFAAYVGAMEDTVRAGKSLRDSKQLIWRFAKRMGYRPEADIFDRFTDDDIVEFYTPDNQQLFRNLRFFDFCSMSLEEIAHCQWNKVSKRRGAITLQMLGLALKLKVGAIRETLDVQYLGTCRVEELLGEKRAFNLRMKYLSPLWEGNRVVAVLTVNHSSFL
jgi:hypothetical protein